MSKNTKIEWADSSWSPWRGCTKVSPGCANCYAETLSKRNPSVLGEWGKGKPRVLAKNWNEPFAWNRRAAQQRIEYENRWEGTLRDTHKPHSLPPPPPRPSVFPSLCDWLDDEVPIEWLIRFLELIHNTPNLNWLLLTKRPENFRQRLAECLADRMEVYIGLEDHSARMSARAAWKAWDMVDGWLNGNPPQNVWFGVSVEDQIRADERIPLLLQIPARVRWLSLEPLLGPVGLECVNDGSWWDMEGANKYDALRGIAYWLQHGSYDHGLGGGPKLDWLVIGGESGGGARPCDVEWIRSIIDHGLTSRVPVFVKQLGAVPAGSWVKGEDDMRPLDSAGWGNRIRHPKGGEWNEWPADLRIRQYPEVQP